MSKTNSENNTKKNENFKPQENKITKDNDVNQKIIPKLNDAVDQKIIENNTINNSQQQLDKKLDSTHFGDWQINCRTIDF